MATYKTPPKPNGSPAPKGLRVEATLLGYYGEQRRRVGDVFTLARPEHFSARWMRWVSTGTPERATGPAEALRTEHQAIRRGAKRGPAIPALEREDGDDDSATDAPTGDARVLEG